MSETLAFVMDPMAGINVDSDTSFAFMLAGAQRGCRILHVNPVDLDLQEGNLFLRGTYIEVVKKQGEHYQVIEKARVPASDCKAILIRTDPPFDEAYLTATWLLSFAERDGVRVINSPHGIRSANEKLYALEFPELCHETIITSSKKRDVQFLSKN